MNDHTEIFIFSSDDMSLLVLKDQLDANKIEYLLRDTTAYMESGIELKIRKQDFEKVDKLLKQITQNSQRIENVDSRETPSVFGKIRLLTNWIKWTAILITAVLLVYMVNLILKGELPQLAWTAIIFMTAFLGLWIYLEKRSKH